MMGSDSPDGSIYNELGSIALVQAVIATAGCG